MLTSPTVGGAERLVPRLTPYFDREFYLTTNTDVREAGQDPVLHYVCHGEAEGRYPRPDFDPVGVRAELAPSLSADAGNLFHYCIEIGYFEARAAERAAVAAIAPCFDHAFYLAENPDVAAAQLDPVLHYIRQGEAEGRRPRADFDPKIVRLDLGERLDGYDGNLFAYCIRTNYLSERARELADAAAIRPFFDRDYYDRVYPDVAAAGVDPILHYLRDGEREGRRPRKDFNPRAYGALLSIDEKVEITNLFAHFVTERGADFSLLQHRPSAQPAAPANVIVLAHHHELANDIRPYFDAAHYLSQFSNGDNLGIEPVLHYLAVGEAAGLNPRADFDVAYYLETNLDLKAAGISPFGHYVRNGRAERRSPAPYHKIPGPYTPLVSVIVPNYNHAAFLPQRFESIFAQTYRNFELIVLDDGSTDDSIAVIEAARASGGERFRTRYNAVNGGNVFAQWRRGVELAQGELIWICESDDHCEPDFLERMVGHFRDRAIMLAFGRIQYCDAQGVMMPGLDEYRESAWPGMWGSAFKRPAKTWFFECLGVKNVIANVGGCVFRRQDVPARVWAQAETYRIAGDWFLYAELAGGGCIAYEPAAVAYFRQHGKNTSASNFREPYYYREHAAILRHLIEMWGLPARTRQRLIEKIREEYDYHRMSETPHVFEDLIPVRDLMALGKQRQHVQFGALGFFVGGGEAVPINLANLFLETGAIVTMVCTNMHSVVPEVAARLNRRVAVYDATDVVIQGRDTYLEQCGIDIVNSHIVQCDHQFFRYARGRLPVPYVVTLHGSYDVMDFTKPGSQAILKASVAGVTAWIYVADKNLKVFERHGLALRHAFKVNNAMPADPAPFPKTRAELGIDPDAVVFTMVARGIERKGWRASVAALRGLLRARPEAKVHLLLAGDGEAAAAVMATVTPDEPITWLGFQTAINGLYRMSDCAVVPTRFAGESNPLCLIQAVQEGLAVIATDIGDIRNMLTLDGELCGILLEEKRDTDAFIADLQAAMARVLDDGLRTTLAAQSRRLAPKFDTVKMVEEYQAVFAAAGAVLRDAENGQAAA